MSQTSVSATQATKEAKHGDPQEDGENTPAQADSGEQAEATAQDAQSPT